VHEPRRTSYTRRTTLGLLGVALAGTAGCSVDSTVDSLRPSPLPTPQAPTNPDLALVSEVRAAIATADRQAPADFTRRHDAQLASFPPSRHAAHRAGSGSWQSRQQDLVATLTDAAVRAEDPDLVRALASMAAAQRQLLASRGLA